MAENKISKFQARVLIALIEAPLHGIQSLGERSVVWAMEQNPPGMAKIQPKGNSALCVKRKQARAAQAVRKLRERGFIEVKHYKDGRKWLPAVVTLTDEGRRIIGAFLDSLREDREKKVVKRKRGKTRGAYTWSLGMEPERRWERWYTTRFGWRAIIEYHPVEGWRFKLIKPTGVESAWCKAVGEKLPAVKREAEATLRKYARGA